MSEFYCFGCGRHRPGTPSGQTKSGRGMCTPCVNKCMANVEKEKQHKPGRTAPTKHWKTVETEAAVARYLTYYD